MPIAARSIFDLTSSMASAYSSSGHVKETAAVFGALSPLPALYNWECPSVSSCTSSPLRWGWSRSKLASRGFCFKWATETLGLGGNGWCGYCCWWFPTSSSPCPSHYPRSLPSPIAGGRRPGSGSTPICTFPLTWGEWGRLELLQFLLCGFLSLLSLLTCPPLPCSDLGGSGEGDCCSSFPLPSNRGDFFQKSLCQRGEGPFSVFPFVLFPFFPLSFSSLFPFLLLAPAAPIAPSMTAAA